MKRDTANATIYVLVVLALTGAATLTLHQLGITDGSTANLLMFLPGLVAIALLALRRQSMRSMGWTVGRIAYWPWALLLPMVALLIWIPLSLLLGTSAPAAPGTKGAALAHDFLRLGRNVAIYLAISVPLALGEEVGWRGYLQPRLVSAFGWFRGLLVLGLVWGLWHVPIYYVMGNYAEYPILGPFVMTPVDNLLAVVPMAWLYVRSGSIWVPTIAHAFADVLWGFSAIVFPPTQDLAHWAILQAIQLVISAVLLSQLMRGTERHPGEVGVRQRIT
jgi:membrane protease YdiL (CAAX protease family)